MDIDITSGGLSKREANKIEELLNLDMTVLEWGSGNSTLYFSKLVKKYCSVEHDKSWAQKVKKSAPKNVDHRYVPNNLPRSFPFVKEEEFVDYINEVENFDEVFDLVFIDGRARIFCAKKCLPHLSVDGIVLIHDWDREPYHSVLEWYDVQETVEKLVVLKPKKDLDLFSI